METLYRSKPTEVEAVKWTGTNFDELEDFGAEYAVDDNVLYVKAGSDGAQGLVPVPHGHWIVRKRGDKTDHWPVSDSYFTDKYEPLRPDGPS